MKSTSTQINTWFQQLSDDQKIGQLIFVSAYSDDREDIEKITEYIQKYQIGGLIFFQGEPIRQAQLTNQYQQVSNVPLFIAMDAEWGLAMRLENTQKFPYQMSLGASDSDDLLYEMGRQIAQQCTRLGVHINFAPVVDLNNNPDNPVISFRSFGEDKIQATHKAKIYMNALEENGVLACLKHFPGHGDTDTDSHFDLPVLMHSKSRLDELELFPFRALFKENAQSVMTAHLHIPALDAEEKAGSLSHKIVTELLQNECGFEGLIFTDAMDMKAVYGRYESGRADVEALKAGNDILLSCADIPSAIEAIKKAIQSGELQQDDIDKKVKKILKYKLKYGLDKPQNIQIFGLLDDLNSQDSFWVNQKLADKFVTVVRNEKQQIPFQLKKNSPVLISVQNTPEQTIFSEELGDLPLKIDLLPESNLEEIDDIFQEIKANKSAVILAIHGLNVKPTNHFEITDKTRKIINKISEINNVTAVLFGNPYAVRELPELMKIEGLIITYEETEFTQISASRILRGGIKSAGKLPVSIGI